MREKPNVGGIQFKTKKELKEYTKSLLHTKGICRIDKTDKDYEFFYDLYLRKPSHKKYISSIISFEINQNPIHKNKIDNLSVIDINNKKYVISWNDCCDGLDKNNGDKLREACRTSIHYQIKETWCNSIKCFTCGKIKTNEEKFEIDHYTNEFCKIYDNFIKQNKLKIPDDFHSNSTSQYSFKYENKDFQKSFEEFHKKEADLELLCYDCHRIKSNNFTSKKSAFEM